MCTATVVGAPGGELGLGEPAWSMAGGAGRLLAPGGFHVSLPKDAPLSESTWPRLAASADAEVRQ